MVYLAAHVIVKYDGWRIVVVIVDNGRCAYAPGGQNRLHHSPNNGNKTQHYPQQKQILSFHVYFS
jgi:hypothetical protein